MTELPTTAAPAPPQADYEDAGFGHALVVGRRPALVLVDPVVAYTDPACPLYAGVEEAVAGMHQVLAAARAAGLPVVVTQVSYRPDGVDGGLFFRKVPAVSAFVVGSPFARVIPGLEPAEGELLLTKQYPSAFFGTTLAATLTALGVDTVFLAGLSTSGCIRATALDALQHGFVPVVVEDAVGDRDRGVHEANLFDIRHKIGEVWPLRAVVEHLERSPREETR